MPGSSLIAAVLLWSSLCCPCTGPESSQQVGQVSELLRIWIDRASDGETRGDYPQRLQDVLGLYYFYHHRDYEPVWISDGCLQPQAHALLQALAGADREGLDPGDYHVTELHDLMAEALARQAGGEHTTPQTLAELELLLTDAFLCYGSHLARGRAGSTAIRAEWSVPRSELNVIEALWQAVDTGDVTRSLASLRPSDPVYDRLVRALARHRQILVSGGWPQVFPGPPLQDGDRGPRVAALRERLLASGDLERPPVSDPAAFDTMVTKAVRRFQTRHGQIADGVVGTETLDELNVPLSYRIRQLQLNLERWRWLPRDLGARHILVNIPGFELAVIDSGQRKAEMRVIVGRESRGTPILSSRVTCLEFNPYWNVPLNVARKDLLPRVQEDPDYLRERNIKVFSSWQPQAVELAVESVDWHDLDPWALAYRFRQEPGPENALGRIKFMFANPFNVYLHDTPDSGLFELSRRCFSSGCVRVEDPLALAAYLLDGRPQWTPERIEQAMTSGDNLPASLPAPLPVHILYFTAWVDESGAAHFRPDVYGRDIQLHDVLWRRVPPRRDRAGESVLAAEGAVAGGSIAVEGIDAAVRVVD